MLRRAMPLSSAAAEAQAEEISAKSMSGKLDSAYALFEPNPNTAGTETANQSEMNALKNYDEMC